MQSTQVGPLAGIRVLDLSRVIAGPFCTMQLADLGADIIKVEHPRGGDDSRAMKPHEIRGESPTFLAFNRGKRSIALDLRSDDDATAIRQLIRNSDVLVENFRPGVMSRLGLAYEAVAEINPHIVYCSISAYGQTGSMSKRPGFDPILQAEMGMMSLNGEPQGQPLRHPLSISDMLTGFYATTAILAALNARGRTGKGEFIDICLMDSVLAVLSNAAQHHLVTGLDPVRSGNVFLPGAPASLFRTATEPVYISAINDKLFGALCRDVLERPTLLDEERFKTNQARVHHRPALFALIEEVLATQSAEHWNAKMAAAGVPAGIVRTVSEALASKEARERRMVVEVKHPSEGALSLMGTPFKFRSALPEFRPPPMLDEHREEILAELVGSELAQSEMRSC